MLIGLVCLFMVRVSGWLVLLGGERHLREVLAEYARHRDGHGRIRARRTSLRCVSPATSPASPSQSSTVVSWASGRRLHGDPWGAGDRAAWRGLRSHQ